MRKILLLALSGALAWAQSVFATFDVVAKQSAKLAMQTNGVVSAIYVKEGQLVKRGDLLASLDSSSEKIAQEIAARNALFAKNSFDKVNSTKSVSSKQSFDEAKFRLDTAELELKRLNDLIAKKSLYAPFDGVIAAKLTEVGEGVAAISQPLFLLQTASDVQLLIGVDVSYAGMVKLGDKFKFSYAGKSYSVNISEIVPNVNPNTQKFYVKANAKGLVVGAFGQGELELK